MHCPWFEFGLPTDGPEINRLALGYPTPELTTHLPPPKVCENTDQFRWGPAPRQGYYTVCGLGECGIDKIGQKWYNEDRIEAIDDLAYQTSQYWLL